MNKTIEKTRAVTSEIVDHDGKALAPVDPVELRELRTVAATPEFAKLSADERAMSMIASAVAAGRSVEEVGRLIEFKERLEADAARKAYNRAMALFQAKCPPIPKTGRAKVNLKSGGSYEYSFPKLEVIMEHVRPHLAANGLSVTFSDFVLLDGFIELACLIRHAEGHIEKHPIKMPIDRSLTVNDMQKVGVVNSYARRYAVVNALNVVGCDPDNDGHGVEVERVNDQEIIVLRDWLTSSEGDEAKFCEYLRINRLEDLPQRRYMEALNALKDRDNALAARKAKEPQP